MRKLFIFALTALGMLACTDSNTPDYPAISKDDVLSGAFSVSETKQVYFSQGNLQATTTDLGKHWTWSFATNQWDYIGGIEKIWDPETGNNYINGNGTVSQNGTVDLFGWSTAATHYGIHNSTSFSTYSGDFVDWGNIMGNGWRTLSYDEWYYLLYTRTNASNLRGLAMVNEVHGCIILPDNWVTPSRLSFTACSDVTANQYTASEWMTMESSGAVFLPAAGDRIESEVRFGGHRGIYWSSTPSPTPEDEDCVFNLYFVNGIEDRNMIMIGNRCLGRSVRLVQDL